MLRARSMLLLVALLAATVGRPVMADFWGSLVIASIG